MPPPSLPEGALNPLTQVTEKGIRQDRPEVPLSFPMAGEQSLHPSSAGPGASLWRWGQGLIDAHPSCHPSHFPPDGNEAVEVSEVQEHPEEVQH